MRALAIFAALALVTAPVLLPPSMAHADGIERPRQRQRPPPPPAPLRPPAMFEEGRETVTLPDSFFVGGGGVGADVGLEAGPLIISDGRLRDRPWRRQFRGRR